MIGAHTSATQCETHKDESLTAVQCIGHDGKQANLPMKHHLLLHLLCLQRRLLRAWVHGQHAA